MKNMRCEGLRGMRRIGWRAVALTACLVPALQAWAAKPPDKLPPGTFSAKVGDNRGAATPPVGSPEIAPNKGGPSLQQPVPGGPHPVIKAIDEVHDFGTIWVGPTLQHTFRIKNEGDAELQITQVKPACGCTIAGSYPKTLQAGETGDFPFSLASTKLHGKFEKAVTIASNDPVTPSLRLRLRGEVKRYLEVAPASVQYPKLVGGDPVEREVTITNNTDQALELQLDAKPIPGLDVKLEPTTPGKVYKLRVTATPPFEPGLFRKMVTLTTNLEAQKTVDIDVRGTVPPRLEINPTILTLGMPTGADKDRQINRQIRFQNYGATPTKVTGATIDDPKVKVAVQEVKAGQTYTIQVEFPAGYELPVTGRTVTIATDDSAQPTLPVAVRGLSAPTAAAKPPTPSRPAEGLVGKPAPQLALKTMEGKSLSNADFASNPATVLFFFAPNCGFCKKALPTVEKVRAEYVAKGVRFVNVAQKMRKDYTNEEIVDVLKGTGSNLELTTTDFAANSVGAAFGAQSFPTMVVVGKSGKVEAVNIGAMADLESRLRTQLDALIAGKPIPDVTAVAQKPATEPTPSAPVPPAPADAKPPAPTQPQAERVDSGSLVGKTAPALALTTLDGKSVSNADFAKAPATVLNFFAPNCGFCKKAMPTVDKMRAEFEAKGVRFVNVAQQMKQEFTPDQIQEVLKTAGSHLELTTTDFGPNAVGRAFGANGFPTMVIVGKSGKVETVNVGAMPDLEARMKAQLGALVEGKPIPAQYVASAKPAGAQQRPAEALAGTPAPDFALTTAAGKSVSKASLSEHPATVLNFFAPNCGFCKKAMPNVEKVRQEYEAKGVRFVNVAQKMRQDFTVEQIQEVLKGVGANLELATSDFATNQVGQSFKVQSFPTMFVVGKDGKIVHVNVGAKADLETALKTQLDGLLKG